MISIKLFVAPTHMKKKEDQTLRIEEAQGALRESIRQTKKLAEQAEVMVVNQRRMRTLCESE